MKLLRRILPFILGPLVLISCASVPQDEPSAYGAFLAARYAGSNRDAQGAATYYAEALNRAPGSAVLADRAYIAALLAGDMDGAARHAQTAIAAGDVSRLASLYRASDLVSQGRYQAASTVLLDAPDFGPFNAFMADMIMQWALMGAGESEHARRAAERQASPGYLEPFVMLHRAMLADVDGDAQAANTNYQRAVMTSPFQRMVTQLYGAFLEREGRRDDAEALYRRYLNATPDDAVIAPALDRVLAGGRPPRRIRVAEGAALSVFGPSASLAAQADMDLTVLYLRMIQRLYPGYAPNRLLLGETLQRIRLPEVALVEYEAVPRGPHWLGAQIDLIWLMARLDQLEEATIRAQALIADSGDDEARLMLADLYRVQARCADATDLYATVISNREAAGLPGDWRYHYFRASCFYVIGEVDAAEREYVAALELGPDEAQVLNDLGYLWIENGERIDEAFAMVERAALLQPDHGHIIDSLGWAYYQLGDYERAVQELERAAELEPGNATANFHLGDAYWQVGRRLEARFQWQRALTLEPDEDEREALEDRLANGLPPVEETEMAEHASG